MKTFRLALIAAAAVTLSFAASAQTGGSTTPEAQQNSSYSCGSKARPGATSWRLPPDGCLLTVVS
jgi:hypothetical protein